MKNLLKSSLVVAAAMVILTGCNCFKKASKRVDELAAVSVPAPVAVVGNVVPFTAEVAFPAKFMNKKATYKITPVFLSEAGEVVGNPTFFQGEKVVGNYTVIPTTGGVAVVKSSIEYDQTMRVSALLMRVEVKCNEKSEFMPLVDLPAAKGVSILQNLTKSAEFAIAKHNFKRVTTETEQANIMFKINSSRLTKAELSNTEVLALEQFIMDNTGNDRRTLSDVHTKSYASPDGPLKFNDKLSKDRAKITEKDVARVFKKNNINSVLDVDALGEDWEGFKNLVQESDIAEKDMILQILNMYNDPAKRDEEIKNMSSVFTILAEKILPSLRRSQMEVSVDIQGYTDEELKNLVANNIEVLNLEELLFAATLCTDLATKTKIYEAAVVVAPTCWRANNNLGVVCFANGNQAKAKELFANAAKINANSAEVINNIAAVLMSEGEYKQAQAFLAPIADKNDSAKENYGVTLIREGKYTEAIKYTSSSNKAIAQILVGDIAGAKQTLKSCKCDSAKGVKAVIAAKEGDFNTASTILGTMSNPGEFQIEVDLLK